MDHPRRRCALERRQRHDAALSRRLPAPRTGNRPRSRHPRGLGLGALIVAAIASLHSVRSFQLLFGADALSFLVFVPLLITLHGLDAADPSERSPGGYREILRDRVFVRVWMLTAVLVLVGYA